MPLEVITGTKEEFDNAIACPAIDPDDFDTIEAHLVHLDNCLQEQSAANAETISFQSVVPAQTQSDNFSLIGDIMRTMLAFMDWHEYPKTIRIVCDSEETAKLYKVIFNFWFADEKTERMEDDSWD